MASILEARCHVALRLRARTQQEIMREDPPVWTIKPPSTLRVDPHLVSNPGAADRCEFAFSECYSQDADNEQVYDRSVRHLTLAAQKGVTGASAPLTQASFSSTDSTPLAKPTPFADRSAQAALAAS